MKRAALATVLLSVMLVVGGSSKAAERYSITVACTGGTVLSGPGRLGNTCTTPEVGAPVPLVYTASARVHIDGIGIVGGSVQLQAGVNQFTNTGDARSCGPVLLSCDAATSYAALVVGDPGQYRVRAVCDWSGVIALSNSVVCEMTVAIAEF